MIPVNISLRVVQLVLQVAIGLFIAKISGADGNGYFSLFITETNLFALFLGLSMDSGIVYFSARDKINLSQITAVFIPVLVVQLLAGLALYAGIESITGYQLFKVYHNISSPMWGFAYIFSLIIINSYTGYNNSKGVFNSIIIYGVIINLLLLVLIVMGKYIPPGIVPQQYLTIQYLLPAYVIVSVIYAVVLLVYTYAKHNDKIHLNDFTLMHDSAFRKYISNVYMGNLVQFCAYRMDIWFVNYFYSKADVGNYALSSKLAQFWWILPQFIAALLFPITASGTASKYNFNKIIRYIIIFNIVAAVLAAIVYPFFISHFMGTEYAESYYPFILLLPGVVVFSINTFLAARLAGLGHVNINRQASIICFIIILILDFTLIPKWGINGAAIASTIGYSLSTFFVMYKYLNLKADESTVAG